MKVYDSNVDEGFIEAGTVEWGGEGYSVETDDEEIRDIVNRVNNARTWDTAEPPSGVDAPVAEADESMDRSRAKSLLETYLRRNGFGVAEEEAVEAIQANP